MHSPLDTAITIKARQYIQQKTKKFVLQPKKSPTEFLIKKQEKQYMNQRNNFIFNVDTISQIPIQPLQTKRMCTSQRTYRSKCATGRPLKWILKYRIKLIIWKLQLKTQMLGLKNEQYNFINVQIQITLFCFSLKSNKIKNSIYYNYLQKVKVKHKQEILTQDVKYQRFISQYRLNDSTLSNTISFPKRFNKLMRGQTLHEPKKSYMQPTLKLCDSQINQTNSISEQTESRGITRRNKKSLSQHYDIKDQKLTTLVGYEVFTEISQSAARKNKKAKQIELEEFQNQALISDDAKQQVAHLKEKVHQFNQKIRGNEYEDDYKPNRRVQYTIAGMEQTLSLDELMYLKSEFREEEYKRNYLDMDQVLLKNKFFQRFDKGVRIGLIEKCELVVKENGFTLLSYGDNRSCSLRITIQIENIIQNLVVQSYYDGQYISELNLIPPNSDLVNAQQFVPLNRSSIMVNALKNHPQLAKFCEDKNEVKLINSDIMIQEDSYLLKLGNDHFQTMLIQSIEKDLDVKLMTLMKIPFFQKVNPETLLPLAAVLGSESYHQGDIILKKGELLNRVIIVQTGEFDVTIETRVRRETRNCGLEKKLKPFQFNQIEDNSCQKIDQKDPADQGFDLYTYQNNYKCQQYGNKTKVNKNCVEYSHTHVTKTLKSGDLICGRVLLMIYDYDYPKDDSLKYAKINVVTSSIKGTIYYLDLKQYQSLPESLQSLMIYGLKQMKEFDDHDVKQTIKNIQQWESYKEAYFKSFSLKKKANTYKLY